jgi:hypothetical protein
MANTIIIARANGSLAIPTVDYLLQHSPDSTLLLTVRDASEEDTNTSALRTIVSKPQELEFKSGRSTLATFL